MKAVRKTGKIDAVDPVLSHFPPGGNLGSTSEAFAQLTSAYYFQKLLAWQRILGKR
jgi:DNA-directed RNA polymerase I subunit RPA1